MTLAEMKHLGQEVAMVGSGSAMKHEQTRAVGAPVLRPVKRGSRRRGRAFFAWRRYPLGHDVSVLRTRAQRAVKSVFEFTARHVSAMRSAARSRSWMLTSSFGE